jgi:hypothetical protein
MTSTGQLAGTIVWEVKQTKTWSDSWIDKLKNDQRDISGECAAIVTNVMPKGVVRLGLMEGVWITDAATVPGLAHALRTQVIQLCAARAAASGKGEKMEILYQYLTGTQFRQRVEAMVEDYQAMQSALEQEKRAFQKIWATREKQIGRIMRNTVGIYGDVQGIVGLTLQSIPSLELPQLTDVEPAEVGLPDRVIAEE